MFAFILRVIAVFCLALAVMFFVIDASRSVGVSDTVVTALGESWEQFLPDTLSSSSLWLSETVHPFVSDPILATALEWPTFLVFAVISALFYILGYRRKRPSKLFNK